MSKLLIFGGTTEGRELAEFCAENQITADVSSATKYGAKLLPKQIGVICGKKDANAIFALLQQDQFLCVIDATHPYAVEATANIRSACVKSQIPYYRLLRNPVELYGETVCDMHEMTALLNQTNQRILSTLGSKSIKALTAVENFRDRIWLRMMPSDTIIETCNHLGYDRRKLILANGPFSTEENISHIRQSGAKILLTKESGSIGGYPEKAKAAAECSIRMITLCRPSETGYTFCEIKEKLIQMKKDNLL